MLDNPGTSYYALNNRNDGTFQDVKFFRTHAMEEMLKAAENLDTGTALVGVSGRVYMVREPGGFQIPALCRALPGAGP